MNLSEYSNIIPLGCSHFCFSVVWQLNYNHDLNLFNCDVPFGKKYTDIQKIYRTLLEMKEEAFDIKQFINAQNYFPEDDELKNLSEEIKKFINKFFKEKNLLFYTDLTYPDFNVYKPKEYYIKNFDTSFEIFQSNLKFLKEILKFNSKNEIIYFSHTIPIFKDKIDSIDGNIHLVDPLAEKAIFELLMDYSIIQSYNPIFNLPLPPDKNTTENHFIRELFITCYRSIKKFLDRNYP